MASLCLNPPCWCAADSPIALWRASAMRLCLWRVCCRARCMACCSTAICGTSLIVATCCFLRRTHFTPEAPGWLGWQPYVQRRMELVVIDSTHIGMSKSAPLAHVGRELARRLSLQSTRKKSSWLTPLALPKYTPPRMPHVRRQLQGAPHYIRRRGAGGFSTG